MVLGNPVYDLIETPFIKTKKRVLSGCSVNACIVLSLLGEDVTFVGCVGEDRRRELEKDLKNFGIQYEIQNSLKTGGFHLIYDENGNRTLDILGIADEISHFPKDLINAKYVLFGPVLSEIPSHLVDFAKKNLKARLFLDPQGFLRVIARGKLKRVKPKFIEKLCSNFDFLKPNEHEALVITGLNARKNPKEVCEILHSWGSKIVIVTLAERGSVIYDGSEFFEIPAFKTNAIDPTGAGDTYAGGFLYKYKRCKDLFEAGLFASCVASIMVENVGPYIPLTLEEVEGRVESLRRL
ncbi:MAG: carbohydrate kinase family protein [Candidatus Methanofastidiosia archaeon]